MELAFRGRLEVDVLYLRYAPASDARDVITMKCRPKATAITDLGGIQSRRSLKVRDTDEVNQRKLNGGEIKLAPRTITSVRWQNELHCTVATRLLRRIFFPLLLRRGSAWN